MNHNSPLILISNDDGYQAGGINALIDIARGFGDVVAVAPSQPQSGKSSAITVDTPLRLTLARQEDPKDGLGALKLYHANGTPADCVKLAFFDALEGRTPSIALAGINHGFNSGNSVIYSGTMGAVFESAFHGVPSVGFSYGDYSPEIDFAPLTPLITQTIGQVLRDGLPAGVCLNINYPKCDKILGVKTVRASMGHWESEFERRVDPMGRRYYWLTGHYSDDNPDDPTTDTYWLARGYATVVPCRADQTAHDLL